jgi:hypothetical protein
MHGMDIAFPFLDRDLIAFLMAIPGEVQSCGGVPKAILRRALRGVLPDAIASRASKADFTALVNAGVAADRDRLARTLGEDALVAKMGYVRRDWRADLINGRTNGSASCDASWALADLASLELWLQEFFGASGRSTAWRWAEDEQTI